MLKRILFLLMVVIPLQADVCQDTNRGAIWCPGTWQFNTTYCTGPCGYPYTADAEYGLYYCPGNPAGEQTCVHWLNCSCRGASYITPFKNMIKRWMQEHLRLTLWNDPGPVTTKSGCQAKATI